LVESIPELSPATIESPFSFGAEEEFMIAEETWKKGKIEVDINNTNKMAKSCLFIFYSPESSANLVLSKFSDRKHNQKRAFSENKFCGSTVKYLLFWREP
jgi:hypothetical protein